MAPPDEAAASLRSSLSSHLLQPPSPPSSPQPPSTRREPPASAAPSKPPSPPIQPLNTTTATHQRACPAPAPLTRTHVMTNKLDTEDTDPPAPPAPPPPSASFTFAADASRASSAPPAAAMAAAAAASPPPRLFGDGFTTTVLQTAPADPRVSRAALPVSYDRRAWLLLARMAAAAAVFAVVAVWAAVAVVAAVGVTRLAVLMVAAEAAFFVYYRRKYELLNAQPLRHAPERHDALAAFNRLLQVCRFFQHKIDARVYLSTWFCGADYRLIRRDNVADLIAYGFWYMSRSEMEAAGLGPLLRQCVSALEAAFNIALPPGHQRGLRCMYHLWEPLRTIYRPLLFYVFTELLALLTKALLLALGCGLHTDPITGLMVATYGLDEQLRSHKVWGTSRAATPVGGGSEGGETTNSNKNRADKAAAAAAAACGDAKTAAAAATSAAAAAVGGWATAVEGRPTVLARWDSGTEESCGGGGGGDGGADSGGVSLSYGSGDEAGGGAGRGLAGGSGSGGCGGPAVTPVLLLHGVGAGLLPYINLVRCLLAAGLPLVAVEYKHVSMRLCSIIPSADDIASGAVDLMDRLGLQQACVVAHSYGTFVASRMAQLHADRMQSMALLDPVCFGMFMPHLLANFIYRQPRTSAFATWIKDMMMNFVSRDLHCAAALCRRFYWSDVNLWPQDIPGRTLVAIAGHDQLIHVDEVLDFIQHYAAKILYHPGHSHAQLLLDPNWQQQAGNEGGVCRTVPYLLQIVADIVAMASSGGGVAGAKEVERRLTSMPAAATTAAAAAAAALTVPAAANESMSEAVATAAPGVVRRVTTQRMALLAGPPPPPAAAAPVPPIEQQQQQQQGLLAGSFDGAAPAAAAAAAGGAEEEVEEDVASLAAALSLQIGQARERMETTVAAAAAVAPPAAAELVPEAKGPALQGGCGGAARHVSAGAGVAPPVMTAAAAPAARPAVQRRCTAAARLQHDSSEGVLLMWELAEAGRLNHAVLIRQPKAAAAAAAAGAGALCSGAAPVGGLRQILPSIRETREDASGPTTPVWYAPPPPSASVFAAAVAAAAGGVVPACGGGGGGSRGIVAAAARRTMTT
ncbi:hypothetical protein PLESTM_001693400 [Pleodorina starrii]|nr:hypothetical protein PLESTM_001693400 [Pleodorina starrii]